MKQKMRWVLGAWLMFALTFVLAGAPALAAGEETARAGGATVKTRIFYENFDSEFSDWDSDWDSNDTWYLTSRNDGWCLVIGALAKGVATITSPTCNLNRDGVPVLSFAYKNASSEKDVFDKLTVCYRVNGGEWQKLFQTQTRADEWVEINLYLPDETKQENVQFAFMGDSLQRVSPDKLCIDDVSLVMVEPAPTYHVTYDANGGTGSMPDPRSPYDVNETVSVMGNQFTAPEGRVFESWNTKADGSGTTYRKGDFFSAKEVTLYAQWVERATVLAEGFETSIVKSEWRVECEGADYWNTSSICHSGEQAAFLSVRTEEQSYAWLISAPHDVDCSGRALLSFWYRNPENGSCGELSAYYSVDGGEWKELFKTEEHANDWKQKSIALPEEAMRENVRIAFKGVCKRGTPVYVDDVLFEIVESVPECTVTYDANGGDGSMIDPNGAYAYGTDNVKVLANGFARPSGKYFYAWNTKADGSGTTYEPGDSMMLLKGVTLYAQWRDLLTSLEEDFGGGLTDERWKQECDQENYYWGAVSVNHTDYYIYTKSSGRVNDGAEAWIITRPFDFSGGGEPRLSFWYKNPASYDGGNDLDVYYRVDGGEWIELFETTDYAYSWEKKVFYLPEDAKQACVEIGFKSTHNTNNYVYLDDVSIQIDDHVQQFTLTYDANGGTGTVTDSASPYVIGMTCQIVPNGFQAPDGKKFKSWNTKQDGSGTDVYPNSTFEIIGDLMLYAQWTEKLAILDEDFESGTISRDWSVITENSKYPWKVISDSDAHSGKNYAYVGDFTDTFEGITCLITPALDLSKEKTNYVLRFWYANPAYFEGHYFNLNVCYRVNGGEWQELFCTDDEHSDWTFEEIVLPDGAMAKNVEIGFKSLEGYSVGTYLDDVTLSEEKIDEFELTFRHNIEFDNNIAMHYVFKKSELKGCSDLKLVINKEVYEKNVATPTIKQYVLENPTTYVIEDEEYWHFTFPGIAAPEMGNVLEAQLIFRKDGFKCMSKKEVYSVMQYAYDRLDETTKESYRSLLVDMLNYGASAQMHFGINTGNLVNAKLPKEQEELETPFFSEVELMNFIELSDATAFFNGTNVLFDNKVMLLFGLDFTELLANLSSDTTVEKKMENVYVEFSWKGLNGVKTQTVLYSEFKIIGDRLAACCDMIAPAEMGCMVNATIYDGNTPISGTIQCSIEAYATDRIFATTSSTYKKLMIDMIVYGKSVNNHFSTVVTK